MAKYLASDGQSQSLDINDLNIVLHAGTLVSILVVYFHRIAKLLGEDRQLVGRLAMATIPAVLVGTRGSLKTPATWCGPELPGRVLAWKEDICISPRSRFGQFLRRPGVLPDLGERLSLDDTGEIILSLFRCLKPWGLVEEVRSPRDGSQIPGYQISSSVMTWKAGDGSRPMFDPLRVTRQSEAELRGNEYFIELYKSFADLGSGLEAREHTAQVQADTRQEREEEFRSGGLPILFCSPTMELGVDIAQLNVVNMRNVPPTPANYAQRSGRAGRSGQPAFVYPRSFLPDVGGEGKMNSCRVHDFWRLQRMAHGLSSTTKGLFTESTRSTWRLTKIPKNLPSTR